MDAGLDVDECVGWDVDGMDGSYVVHGGRDDGVDFGE